MVYTYTYSLIHTPNQRFVDSHTSTMLVHNELLSAKEMEKAATDHSCSQGGAKAEAT